jgi:TatD DNase family protein
MFATLPLDKILLETDAPYLTPVPFRGKINEPAFVRNIAMHQSLIRNISINEIAIQTTANARALFGL